VTSTKRHRAASSNADPLAHVARRAVERDARGREIPEPSLGTRLGQIGVLGWMIIVPMLLALYAGRWFDQTLRTGVFFSGTLLMLGTAIGFWSAWKWMHARGP
jgi:ATP synthase protein I